MTTATAGVKFGPLWLAPGVSRGNMTALLVGSFFTIGLMTTIGHSQAYIFTQHLGIPLDEQGGVAGTLTFYNELVILALVGGLGALSDRIGRRRIYAAGFLIIALGYVLYPLATSVGELTLYRLIFACGAACISAMLATVIADYPQERSRGKIVAMCFFLNGLGLTILVGLFGNTPKWFLDAGAEPVEAGRNALWIVAGLCVVASMVVGFGLKRGAPSRVRSGEGALSTLKIGVKAARNPRIALSYGAGLVSRGDMSVVSTFFTLWLTQVGVSRGLDTGAAFAQGTKFFIIVQVSALLTAPVVGIIVDRIDRVAALAGAMLVAGAGYMTIGFIPDPLGGAMYFAAILMGMGEMTGILAAQALVGQEAPEHGRGGVIGVFSFCGALGILCAAALGGWLFDNWMQSGPFVMMGTVNCILLVAALAVLFVAPRRDVAASATAIT